MKILIDNGHGIETLGKRSPDGLFMEYAYNRELATRIVSKLTANSFNAELLVPELEDVSLAERIRRENAFSELLGCQNVILISIHCNAAGDGSKWRNATGWTAYTTPGITQADLLAYSLYLAAQANLSGQKIRLFNGVREPDFEANLYILKNSRCPAVLTENFFMDNRKDVQFLLSEDGKNALTALHYEGIVNYIANLNH